VAHLLTVFTFLVIFNEEVICGNSCYNLQLNGRLEEGHYCPGADLENELGGGQFRRSGGRKSPSGAQGQSPGRVSGGRSPPESDDFSQLKGYLDVLWRDVKHIV